MLEGQARVFTSCGRELIEWDEALFQAQKQLGSLAERTQWLEEGQKSISTNIATINAHQIELHNNLTDLENSIDAMHEKQAQGQTTLSNLSDNNVICLTIELIELMNLLNL